MVYFLHNFRLKKRRKEFVFFIVSVCDAFLFSNLDISCLLLHVTFLFVWRRLYMTDIRHTLIRFRYSSNQVYQQSVSRYKKKLLSFLLFISLLLLLRFFSLFLKWVSRVRSVAKVVKEVSNQEKQLWRPFHYCFSLWCPLWSSWLWQSLKWVDPRGLRRESFSDTFWPNSEEFLTEGSK